jgi:hypothetical protein
MNGGGFGLPEIWTFGTVIFTILFMLVYFR